MFLETMRTRGLAAFSYVAGSDGKAAVIDPQRDCNRYIEAAHRHHARITRIFETHRNEDFVTGSVDLATRTGASIYHGAHLDFAYGNPVSEGDNFLLGEVRLKVLETPGHTDESISLAIHDTNYSEECPVGVFTGDALFIGDVGRTDFYPERAREVAGLLYDSIHDKLLPLGDQAVVYPAHGAGSVCGSQMAARDVSTLGYERRNNPRLQMSRDEFIDYKTSENHDQPPYFRAMEAANQQGRRLSVWPNVQPCGADAFAAAMDQGMVVLDVREPEAVCGAHIPGSLCIPQPMLAGFAGWYLPYDRPIGLVMNDACALDEAVQQLVRMGYECIPACLAEGMHAWAIGGRDYVAFPTVHARELQRRIDSGESFTLLDVRSEKEWEQARLPGATHIYVGRIGHCLDQVPAPRPLTTLCASGRRALIGASVLERHGFEQVEVALGSMGACHVIGCPMES